MNKLQRIKMKYSITFYNEITDEYVGSISADESMLKEIGPIEQDIVLLSEEAKNKLYSKYGISFTSGLVFYLERE